MHRAIVDPVRASAAARAAFGAGLDDLLANHTAADPELLIAALEGRADRLRRDRDGLKTAERVELAKRQSSDRANAVANVAFELGLTPGVVSDMLRGDRTQYDGHLSRVLREAAAHHVLRPELDALRRAEEAQQAKPAVVEAPVQRGTMPALARLPQQPLTIGGK